MTATECVNFERNYKCAREQLDRINEAWAKVLMTLTPRYFLNTKTNEFKVEYKFDGKWQTAEEIGEQTLQIYKMTEEYSDKVIKLLNLEN